MANLIIKSSADDLVLKGSGGNSAITVAAAGTTTFAENATLSGTANNLGTIASATTFPAGHVIKTYCESKLDVQTVSDVVTREPIGDLLIEDITPKNDSSEFLVRMDITYWGNDIGFQIERKITGGSYAIIQPPTGLSGSRFGCHAGGSHRIIYDLNAASMTLLDAPATALDIHYRITCTNCPGSGPDGYINRASTFGSGSNDEQGISTITVQEIAG